MPQVREVKTCDRCRSFKRRCDLLKPSCTRCAQAGIRCSFDVDGVLNLNDPQPQLTSSTASNGHANGAHETLTGPRSQSVEEDDLDDDAPEQIAGEKTNQPSAKKPVAAENRVIRKRKRNCLSCLRCHKLKVKCDKELPCSRCKASGNSRECYYTYNKGHNEGRFPCPANPTGTNEDESTILAPWQVQHKVRGSSHWRDLMAKVCRA